MLLYLNTLPNGFVYDDHPAIEQNPCVQIGGWERLLQADFWGTPLRSPSSHHSFRPLATLTLRLNRVLDPAGGARGFHAANVLLHGATTGALWSLAAHLLGPGRSATALLSALFFAVHPVNTEAVAYCVGRADVLAAVLGLMGMRAHGEAVSALSAARDWRCASYAIGRILLGLGLLAAALASKETALMFLPACAIFDATRRRGDLRAEVRAMAME